MEQITYSKQEKEELRRLAHSWMEFAASEKNLKSKTAWRNVKDLKADRPVFYAETFMLCDYVTEADLTICDPYLRNVQKMFIEMTRHAEEINDDVVLDPYFRIPWDVSVYNYGVVIETKSAISADGSDLAYGFDHPVKRIEDIDKLHVRKREVDRESTMQRKNVLDEIIGDIIPVIVGGADTYFKTPGYRPFLGNYFSWLTQDLFKLIGNENLLYWVYDEPDAIRRLMQVLCDDRKYYYSWMEKEGLLYANTDMHNPGPGSYGYVSDLPDPLSSRVSAADCWTWTESQETQMIAPKHFGELFLPYMAKASQMFGHVYYGCCERLDDRIEDVLAAFSNIRAVSVSAWSDLNKMGEALGKNYVYSRKPAPAYISGKYPDWDAAKKDIEETLKAAKDCSLEIIMRDVYTIDGDRSRLAKWADMVRGLIG